MFDSVGKALAIIRQERGVSQEMLALTCRIGRSQLSRYESGRELMRLDTLEKMLQALHIAPDQFFRLMTSLDGSLQQPSPGLANLDASVLEEAFQDLHSAIDQLRSVLEQSRQGRDPARLSSPSSEGAGRPE
jgi:transcriptional regulator with XRE-family HTH domain